MNAGTGSHAATAGASGPSLRDIHLPAAPSWWPPAPGWWLLAAIVLLLGVMTAWAWRRHRRAQRRRKQVLDELEQLVCRHHGDGSPAALLQGLHQLLRRVARQHDADAIRQRGGAWRETLARVPVDAATLDQLVALDRLIYQPPGEGDREAIVAAVGQWLGLAVKPSNWKPMASEREAADA
jgi:hypothetical protein